MKKFYNLQYGECILVAESENLYLVFARKNKEIGSYIVCTYMDEMGTLMGQNFFKTLNDAQKFYNSKQEEKIKTINNR